MTEFEPLTSRIGSDLSANHAIIRYLHWVAQQLRACICPIFKKNMLIVLHSLSLLFWYFNNTTDYHLCRYKPSSPSIKEIH